MADWDDEEFEPEAAAPAAVGVNLASDKWDGEDEDDDVKVSDQGRRGYSCSEKSIY